MSVKLPPCQICSKPLSDGERHLNRKWHFDCERCAICNDYFPNSTRIAECLGKQIPVSHITCYQTAEIAKIRTETIPVTQAMLNSVNDSILAMRHTFHPPESDIALLQNLLRSIVDMGKNVSWLLQQTKDKIRIDTISDYDEQVKTEKVTKRAKAAIEQTEKIASSERSEMLATERKDETGMLRNRRKAIESLLAAMPWLSREQAEGMVTNATPKVQ